MSVTLRQPLTLDECQLVREWRNAPDVLPMLRTGYKTEEEQAAFYRNVIGNPDSEHLYYAIEIHLDVTSLADTHRRMMAVFLGMGGLTHLHRTPGEAEISLIMGPEFRRGGYGARAVDALLTEAKRIGLKAVIGECYTTGNLAFWTKQILRRPALTKWKWEIGANAKNAGDC